MIDHADRPLFYPRTDRWLWRGLLVLAAGLRLALIERHGLWNNEFITSGVLRHPLAEIPGERLAVNHLPLYFVLLKLWTGWAGTEEWALRAPSASIEAATLFCGPIFRLTALSSPPCRAGLEFPRWAEGRDAH